MHRERQSGSAESCQALDMDFHLPSSELDNVNVHRAAAKIIVSKIREARGSVCNVLLSRDYSVDVEAILAMASCPCKRRKQCLDILLSDWICALDVPDRERGICIKAMPVSYTHLTLPTKA